MMVRLFSFLFSLLCCLALQAQRSQIKFGGGLGRPAYAHNFGSAAEIQYAYNFFPWLSGFVSSGAMQHRYTEHYFATWNDQSNPYHMSYKERLLHIDGGLRLRWFRIKNFFEFHSRHGGSYAWTRHEYPAYTEIRQGKVVRQDYKVIYADNPMYLIGAETVCRLNERWAIHMSANYRLPVKFKDYIEVYEVIYLNPGKSASSSSGPFHSVSNIVIQVGYRF